MSKKIYSLVLFLIIFLFIIFPFDSTFASSLTLYDSKNYPYDIQDGGYMSNGYYDAYDGCYYLYINNTQYTGTRSSVEDDDREAVCDIRSLAGLNVSRKIFVPETENWARYLEILNNPTENTICVDVEITGNLGSNGSTVIISTSDGDSVFEDTDRWLITDDSYDGAGDPSLAHIFEGPNAKESVDTLFATNNNDNIFYQWDQVCIEPGETKILMHFAVQQINRETAINEANLINPPIPEITVSGLSEFERSRIVNWNLGPRVIATFPSHNAENIHLNSNNSASYLVYKHNK